MAIAARPPQINDLVRRSKAIDTSTWSDALDARGLHSNVVDGIARRAGASRIAGPALTVGQAAGEFGSAPLNAFALGEVFAATTPGTVLVFACGGRPISTFGGLATRHALAIHVEGVIIDGGCRDLEEAHGLGLSIWSAHVTPRSGKRRLRFLAFNAPITCGGVRIAAQDWIVADDTGVVSIPVARLDEVLTTAENLAARDARFAAALDDGAAFGEAVANLGHV